MDVVILGSGNPLPDPNRAGPATLVRTSAGPVLFDAGRGVAMRLAGAGVLPVGLAAVVLTHLHSDHICGLNDVVTSHWVMSFDRAARLVVHGPEGTRGVVDGLLSMLAPDVGYRLAHHDDLDWEPDPIVGEHRPGAVIELGGVRITAAASDHRPVEPTLAFRIDDGDQSVVIAGDTVPCAGLDDLCAGADVYVQTVVRDDLVRAIPNPRFQDILDYHSSVEQAADTAARAGVGTLVLTHMVPAPVPGTEHEWAEIAATRFAGCIVVAADLEVIPARP